MQDPEDFILPLHTEAVSKAEQPVPQEPIPDFVGQDTGEGADVYGDYGAENLEDYRFRQFEVNITGILGQTSGEIIINGGSVVHPSGDPGTVPAQQHKIEEVPQGSLDKDAAEMYVYAATTRDESCTQVTEFILDEEEDKTDKHEDEETIIYTKLAKVEGDYVLAQYVDGPIWLNLQLPCAEGSSDDSSDDSSDSDDDSSEDSSGVDSSDESTGDSDSKDTAIVKCSKHKTGYAAVYCVESTGVVFNEEKLRIKVTGRQMQYKIDPFFREICHAGTLKVICSGDTGWAGAYINGGHVVFTTSVLPWSRPRYITFEVSGIRDGFKGVRMKERTERQFKENRERIRANYSPASQQNKDASK